jgi:hypothetical protein
MEKNISLSESAIVRLWQMPFKNRSIERRGFLPLLLMAERRPLDIEPAGPWLALGAQAGAAAASRAIRLRFWAMAARRNSSLAPDSPRRRTLRWTLRDSMFGQHRDLSSQVRQSFCDARYLRTPSWALSVRATA